MAWCHEMTFRLADWFFRKMTGAPLGGGQAFDLDDEIEHPTPEAVGAEIRRLLLSLRHPEHIGMREGWNHHGTDELRKLALDYAGVCWKAPGELAPGCSCSWPPTHVADDE